MESVRLEQLEQGLHEVLRLIDVDRRDPHTALPPDHPAVLAAEACELMQPEKLTLASLAGSARHKIENVQVLMKRAREHESLPPEAQIAADEGYMTSSDDVQGKPD